MKARFKLIAIAIIATVIGVPVGYFYTQLPKYSDAIMQGTVQSVYQGSDIRPGFARPDAWYFNITLAKGSHGDMGVWEDCPTNVQLNQQCPESYPVKVDGIWVYRVIVNCDPYKVGDSVFLRVPIYQGGNIWSEPKAVQGYNYNNVSPHTYDYPAFYKKQGIGFVPIEGC